MERTQWILTMHFGRGHSEVIKFDSKAEALHCIRIAVFNNEDCINFSCYKVKVKLPKMDDLVLAKM